MNFVTAPTVATMTGFDTTESFLKARNRLERDHQFPEPIPTCLRPMKWRQDAIAAWLEIQGKFQPALQKFSGPNVILMNEARKA